MRYIPPADARRRSAIYRTCRELIIDWAGAVAARCGLARSRRARVWRSVHARHSTADAKARPRLRRPDAQGPIRSSRCGSRFTENIHTHTAAIRFFCTHDSGTPRMPHLASPRDPRRPSCLLALYPARADRDPCSRFTSVDCPARPVVRTRNGVTHARYICGHTRTCSTGSSTPERQVERDERTRPNTCGSGNIRAFTRPWDLLCTSHAHVAVWSVGAVDRHALDRLADRPVEGAREARRELRGASAAVAELVKPRA